MSRQTNDMDLEYWWTDAGTNQYLFNIAILASTTPAQGDTTLDMNNVGSFEPVQGGPRVSVGDTVEGRTVTNIRIAEDGFVVTVD